MNARDGQGPVEQFTIDGFDIEVPVVALTDPLRARLTSGQFETSERALLTRFLRPDDRVLDLGAGAGVVSLTAARIVGPGAVTAVEANPQMHRALRRNFHRNDAEAIRLIKGAVVAADHADAQITLNVNPGFWSASVHQNPRLRSMPMQVPAKRLPQLLRTSGATAIVMDIEGAEREVLRAALPPQIRLIVLELHPNHYGADGVTEVIDALTARGFKAHHQGKHEEVQAFLRNRTA